MPIPCPRCHGTGVVPTGLDKRKQRQQERLAPWPPAPNPDARNAEWPMPRTRERSITEIVLDFPLPLCYTLLMRRSDPLITDLGNGLYRVTMDGVTVCLPRHAVTVAHRPRMRAWLRTQPQLVRDLWYERNPSFKK